MGKLEYTPVSGARDAAQVNTIFTDIDTESSLIDTTNVLPESIDGRILEDRPVWFRLDTLEKAVRNSATLVVVAPPSWATLDHYGSGAVGTGLLVFNFVAYPLLAGEALRFCHWGSWETTLSSGYGLEGEVQLRWEYAGAQLTGGKGFMERENNPATPTIQHGQHYIEGWIEGPATVNGNVQVQYAYGTGGDAFLSRSLTWVDQFRRWNN